uniref:Uncharacterized protein n=1 Tax=Rhizophora mucronata TaxID=61149 RepID=A0A2P2LKH9_RHIMU
MMDTLEKLCTMEVDSNNKFPWRKKQLVVLISRQCMAQMKRVCIASPTGVLLIY